jgi:hypothetical protein
MADADDIQKEADEQRILGVSSGQTPLCRRCGKPTSSYIVKSRTAEFEAGETEIHESLCTGCFLKPRNLPPPSKEMVMLMAWDNLACRACRHFVTLEGSHLCMDCYLFVSNRYGPGPDEKILKKNLNYKPATFEDFTKAFMGVPAEQPLPF